MVLKCSNRTLRYFQKFWIYTKTDYIWIIQMIDVIKKVIPNANFKQGIIGLASDNFSSKLKMLNSSSNV